MSVNVLTPNPRGILLPSARHVIDDAKRAILRSITIIRPSTRIITPGAYGVRILSSRVAAAGDWWFVAGITTIVAYQPIGAANYAASKINLADPGTNDAWEGNAPVWGAIGGWDFNGTNDYLKTGILDTINLSLAIRFSDDVSSSASLGTSWFSVNPDNIGWGNKRTYAHSGTSLAVLPVVTNGVMIITPTFGFYNGMSDGAIPSLSQLGRMVLVGASGGSAAGAPESYRDTSIQAFAIWNGDIASDAATVSAAMAAL